jgi:hypothetical protein
MRAWQSGRRRRGFGEQVAEVEVGDDLPTRTTTSRCPARCRWRGAPGRGRWATSSSSPTRCWTRSRTRASGPMNGRRRLGVAEDAPPARLGRPDDGSGSAPGPHSSTAVPHDGRARCTRPPRRHHRGAGRRRHRTAQHHPGPTGRPAWPVRRPPGRGPAPPSAGPRSTTSGPQDTTARPSARSPCAQRHRHAARRIRCARRGARRRAGAPRRRRGRLARALHRPDPARRRRHRPEPCRRRRPTPPRNGQPATARRTRSPSRRRARCRSSAARWPTALLKPEALARLSDADRELLTRLQAELAGGTGSPGPNGAAPA